MHTNKHLSANNVVKWSFMTGAVAGYFLLAGIFTAWFGVQVLVVLTSLTS